MKTSNGDTFFTFNIFASMPTSGSIYVLSMWSILYYYFYLHCNQLHIFIETDPILFLPIKCSDSGCCLALLLLGRCQTDVAYESVSYKKRDVEPIWNKSRAWIIQSIVSV